MITKRATGHDESDKAATLLGALALVTSDAVTAATEAVIGIRDAAPAALASLLAAPDGRSIDELRRIVGLTPSGGVRLVDRLATVGLVVRRPGVDRRSVIVHLTPSGRRAGRAVLDARASALEQLLAPLTPDERDVLTGLAGRILEHHVGDRLVRRSSGDEPAGGWTCRLCDQQACGRDRGACPAANAASSWVAAHGPPGM